MKRPERDEYPNGIYGDIGYVKQLNKYCSYLENKNQSLQLMQTAVVGRSEQLVCKNTDHKNAHSTTGFCSICQTVCYLP